MKKLLSMVAVMGFVFSVGTAYAAAAGSGADSLLSILDQSKVPGYVELETGVVNAAPKATMVSGGSAAGGINVQSDTFMNYIDPSRLPGYVNLETGVVN